MKYLVTLLLGILIGALPVYSYMHSKVEAAEFSERLTKKVLNICINTLSIKDNLK